MIAFSMFGAATKTISNARFHGQRPPTQTPRASNMTGGSPPDLERGGLRYLVRNIDVYPQQRAGIVRTDLKSVLNSAYSENFLPATRPSLNVIALRV
jgi:hypothetical protein